MTDDSPLRDWAIRGTFRVSAGVYRIPLPLHSGRLRAVNVYVIEDGEDVVVIDSGLAFEGAEDQLVAGLANIGRSLEDVRKILVTHAHRDHYTQAISLRRRFGTRVAIGLGEQPSLKAMVAMSRSSAELAASLRSCGAAEIAELIGRAAEEETPEQALWELPDEWLCPPSSIQLEGRTLDCISTPGHTTGHVVFRDSAAGLLFAGDHVLPHITPSVGFERCPPVSPLATYLASLQLVRQMPDLLLLPAHGPVGARSHRRVDELLLHHEQRLGAAETAVKSGAETAFDVARSLSWTRRARPLGELDSFNQMMAVLETRAHLEVLVDQARAASTIIRGVTHYFP